MSLFTRAIDSIPHPFHRAHQNHPHFVSCGIIVTNRAFCICFHSSSPDVWYDRTTRQLTLDFLSSHSEISGGCNLRFLAGFVGFVSRSRRRDTCCRHFSKCWLLAFFRSPYTRWCLELKSYSWEWKLQCWMGRWHYDPDGIWNIGWH